MTWVSVSDDFTDHPKFRHLDDDATALWIRALAFANRHLTDGVVPAVVLRDLSRSKSPEKVAAKLCAASGITGKPLWSKVEGGYQIHDFHDYQPSARAVRTRRDDTSAKRAESGRKGAEHRWQTDSQRMANGKQTDSERMANDSPADGKRMANGWQTDSQRIASDSPSPSPSPSPLPNPDLRSQPSVAPRPRAHEGTAPDEPEGGPSPAAEAFALSPLDPEPAKGEPKRQRRSAIRDDFAPSESNRAFAVERGFSVAALERERLRFVNYWKSRGEPRADWSAGFRNWLDRADPSGNGNGRAPGLSTLQQPSQCWTARED